MSESNRHTVKIRKLVKRFGKAEVLKQIDLDVAPGQVVALVGPSGSGKTTLLRSVNLLEAPTSGQLSVCGHQLSFEDGARPSRANKAIIRDIRMKTAMVFQSFNLFPHMTAITNVAEGLVSAKGIARPAAEAVALSMLERMGLSDKAKCYPATLSGGQKQRVAIARGLVMQPELMLFDEPTSALDPELRSDVLSTLRQIAATGMTMLVATHEMSFAREIADKIVFMEGGRIHLADTPAAFFGGGDERIARFLSATLS
jgi:cystine transport system ATP-binding protein